MPTTDELYQEYKGTSIPSFDGDKANNGQCEQWYLMCRTQRDGLGVVSGNAIDRWYYQEPQYYSYVTFAPGIYPHKDDYVVWGAAVGSKYGHIDVCAQDGGAGGFVGYDSNWGNSKVLQTITHNYDFGILGYIRNKGADMIETPDEAAEIIRGIFKREPTEGEIADLIGRDWYDGIRIYRTSAPGVQVAAEVNNYANLEAQLAAANGNYSPYKGDPLFTATPKK